MQKTDTDLRIQRHWLLVRYMPALPEEAERVELAKVIDPDAWKIQTYAMRRFLSLEAAYRVSIDRAVREMSVWQEPAPRPSLLARVRAFFAPNQMEPSL